MPSEEKVASILEGGDDAKKHKQKSGGKPRDQKPVPRVFSSMALRPWKIHCCVHPCFLPALLFMFYLGRLLTRRRLAPRFGARRNFASRSVDRVFRWRAVFIGYAGRLMLNRRRERLRCLFGP